MRNRIRIALLLPMALGLLPARDYGPPAGRAMPDFSLQDQDGKTHSLKSLLGPKGALILFFRSADW
ncbi:MAG TPA: hypothetical protein VEV17_02385 [Bryobacteraceae bacterium]|nr:hypothetical protein [Bryobacteraceae bacterium]